MMTDFRSEYFRGRRTTVQFLRLLLACVWIFATFGEVARAQASHVQYGIVYSEIAGQRLTMDYYPAAGDGPHPAAIIIHGGGYTGGTSQNGSEAYCADFLAPAGYAIFSINYRLAPQFPLSAMVADVQRSVRFIRYNASRWNVDARRIALVGGSAGGYLSNMAGLLPGNGDAHASEPIDREDASVQAVVTLYGVSDLVSMNDNQMVKEDHLLGPLHGLSFQEALKAASPVTHVTRHAPPFLLIHGDSDRSVSIEQSRELQTALNAQGASCTLIVIPGGPHTTQTWNKIPGAPDWEREMTAWLNRTLDHKGEIGKGIRPR